MPLDDKLLNAGLVLIVAGPILGLILWRLRRGEVGFDGCWKTPSEVEAMDRAGRREQNPENRKRDAD